MGWDIMLELVQHMDSVDRSLWRLVNKAACEAVYEGTRTMTPSAALDLNTLTASPQPLLSKCCGLKRLSCKGLQSLSSIHGLTAGLEVLDISGTNITDWSPLEQCTALRQLSAPGVTTGWQLPDILQKLTKLQQLNLGHSTCNHMEWLAPAIRKLTGLHKLDLGGNYMGAEGAQALAPALQQLTALQQLNLGSARIGVEGAQALAPALQQLTGLQKLDFTRNVAPDEDRQAWAHVLRQLTGLRQLDFGDNCMGEEGAQALAPALDQLTGLQQLNLGGNHIWMGVRALAPTLQKLTGLRQLDLGRNYMGVDGVRALVPALLHLTGLRHLDLRSNLVHAEDAGAQALASLITRLPNLTVLLGPHPQA